jgi:pimeloyl-ACP methyl ester carboxylesterase
LTVHVNHIRCGTGTPLVLIHGIGHRWQAWEPVLGRLSAFHDVIALDLPGFGGSPVPAAGMPVDMPATVTAIGAVFAHLGLDRPHVAGNSLGGAIALELAATGRVASATAFSPAGFFTAAERRRALAILRALRAGSYLPVGLQKVAPWRAVSVASLVARPGRLTADRLVGDTLALRRGAGFGTVARAARGYAFAGDPPVPVTVGWGAKDRIFRPHQAERVRQLLPRARVVALPGCGHIPMSDDPDLVASLIVETTRD